MAEVIWKLDKTWSTWELRRPGLTPEDILWISSNSIRCELDRKYHSFDNLIDHITKTPVEITGSTVIRITTETPQQEMMLKLKYGDDLLLYQIEGKGRIPFE